jgi:hypothetical protein
METTGETFEFDVLVDNNSIGKVRYGVGYAPDYSKVMVIEDLDTPNIDDIEDFVKVARYATEKEALQIGANRFEGLLAGSAADPSDLEDFGERLPGEISLVQDGDLTQDGAEMMLDDMLNEPVGLEIDDEEIL